VLANTEHNDAVNFSGDLVESPAHVMYLGIFLQHSSRHDIPLEYSTVPWLLEATRYLLATSHAGTQDQDQGLVPQDYAVHPGIMIQETPLSFLHACSRTVASLRASTRTQRVAQWPTSFSCLLGLHV
jgi:hypothetical protein